MRCARRVPDESSLATASGVAGARITWVNRRMDASRRRAAAVALSASLAVALLSGGPARAAPTLLEPNPAEGGAAWTARYSQGVLLTARLTSRGAPVVGERVVFKIARADAPDDEFLLADPVTDGTGLATARLTLVDGRYGGRTFQGQGTDPAEGLPYVVTLEFLGRNPPSLAECQAEADAGPADVDDGGTAADAGAPVRLCAATAAGELRVALELPTLQMAQGNELSLGETVTLQATLVDPNGDAPEAGLDVDGSDPKPIEGGTVSFFYDVDGNGRPSLSERLGTATTDASGVARFEFTADPQFVTAGDFESGLHVQFAGDDRYTIAGDATRLTVLTSEPDPGRTLLEVDPQTAPADGFTIVKLRAKLVDQFNNLLGTDAPSFPVVFTADLGTLVNEPRRDPTTGFYEQDLRAPRAGGTAVIGVTVDGAAGPTSQVEFVKDGCACVSGGGLSGRGGAGVLFALLLLPCLLLRRVRRTS